MIKIIVTLLAFSLSSQAQASNQTRTSVCSNGDKTIELVVKYEMAPNGSDIVSSVYNGIPLAAVKATAFRVLEGYTLGNMVDYETYQLTLIPSDTSTESAVFISQTHTDQDGYSTSVSQLTCLPK